MNDKDKKAFKLSAMTNTTIQLTKVDMDGQVFYSQFAFNLMLDRQKELEAENKKLREALEFYADIRFWEKCNQTHYTNYNRDKEKLGLMWYGGKKAREALKETKDN